MDEFEKSANSKISLSKNLDGQTCNPALRGQDQNPAKIRRDLEFMEIVDYVGRYVDNEIYGAQTLWLSREELLGDFAIEGVN